MAVDHPAQPDDLYWDPYDYALHADSHPVWRRMRDEAPLYRNDALDFWALTRFQDVLDALVDHRTYSSAKGDILEIIQAGQSEFTESMISEDPPTHTMHRQLLSRAFTPRAIKSVEDRVRVFAEMLLDDLIGSGGFDFVDDFGARVPGMVIAAMLGTPDSALEELRHLTDAQLHIGEGEDFDRTAFNESAQKSGAFFMEEALARRKNPTDDIMSALVTMEFTDEHGVTRQLDDLEAVQYIHLLSAAGNETTARFTGWAGATLAQYPEQRAKLVAAPRAHPERGRGDPPLRAAVDGARPGHDEGRDVVRRGRPRRVGRRAAHRRHRSGPAAVPRPGPRHARTWNARSSAISPSDSASTCAWVRRSPAWRRASCWRRC